jgi:hypothetical protein
MRRKIRSHSDRFYDRTFRSPSFVIRIGHMRERVEELAGIAALIPERSETVLFVTDLDTAATDLRGRIRFGLREPYIEERDGYFRPIPDVIESICRRYSPP